jgi:hypothetical protein
MTKRLVLAIVAASITAAASLLASPAYASCLPTTAAQQHARAAVIFDGVALDGPTATGVQRFRVTRYLKGHGSSVLRVQTGNKKRADGSGSITSVSLVVNRGERWRIFARGTAAKVLQTTVCDGSRKR